MIFNWFKGDWSSGYQGIQSREKYFAKYAKLLSDDPGHKMGGSGQQITVLVPVGGETQVWSSKRGCSFTRYSAA